MVFDSICYYPPNPTFLFPLNYGDQTLFLSPFLLLVFLFLIFSLTESKADILTNVFTFTLGIRRHDQHFNKPTFAIA